MVRGPDIAMRNPLKQGLKPDGIRSAVVGTVIAMRNPLKQGLKRAGHLYRLEYFD